jgi:hypothetical protein
MTINQYLTEYLIKDNSITGTAIEVYNYTVHGRGSVTVEYDGVHDRANIIHVTNNGRNDFYEADNCKDLKDVLEFCLGPLVSDSQWKSGVMTGSNEYVEGEELDDIDY